MASDKPSVTQHVFAALGSFVLVVALLYWGEKVLVPLALALLLTFILTPLVVWLQQRKVPRVAAVSLAVLLATSVVAGTAWIITRQVSELVTELPQHSHILSDKLHTVLGDGHGPWSRFQQMTDDLTKQFKEVQATTAPGDSEKPMPVVVSNDQPAYLSFFPTVAGSVAETLASVGLVIMLVIFMLLRREDLRFRMIQLVGHRRLTTTTHALDDAADRISAFLLMQLAVNTLFGFLFFVGLALVGVPYAFLWGFLALVLRFIPYVGTWVAVMFPLTLCIAVFPEWYQLVVVFSLFLTLEVLTANVLEPLLFSHSTGVSPIALLVAAAFWTWLWGPIGLVLSTPLTVCLIVLGRHVPELHFFDVLLGSEPCMTLDTRFYQRLLAQDEDEATDLVEEFLKTHPRERVYDDVLLPALVRMKRDVERGDLEDDDQRFILRLVREVLDDLEEAEPETSSETEDTGEKKVLVVGLPAHDEADELALRMFQQLLTSARCRVEVISEQKLVAEMVRQVRKDRPAMVCIGALPPHGLAHARYLSKRLRTQLPELKILVGRWGQTDSTSQLEQRLAAAGADFVASTLLESRAQAASLVPVAAQMKQDRHELQAAGR